MKKPKKSAKAAKIPVAEETRKPVKNAPQAYFTQRKKRK
jgi:hypothetical protein